MAGHLSSKHGYQLSDSLRGELEEAVLTQAVMPSMRALMTSGPALDRCHVGGYNCSYVPVDSPRAFDETIYSYVRHRRRVYVERHNIEKLPIVAEDFKTDTVIKVGIKTHAKEVFEGTYCHVIRRTDTSMGCVRGTQQVQGSTFGGRASGPQPLVELATSCREV